MKERKKDEEREEEEEGEKKEGRPEEKERSPTGAAMNNWSRASERKRHAGKGAPRAWPLLTGGWGTFSALCVGALVWWYRDITPGGRPEWARWRREAYRVPVTAGADWPLI